MNERTIVVTGVNGFVGRHACDELTARGWKVIGVVRRPEALADVPAEARPEVVTDPLSIDRWKAIMCSADAVLHLAGRAHVTNAEGPEVAAVYWRDNVDLTAAVGRAAVLAGVPHFAYASSVKAVSDGSDVPVTGSTPPEPTDTYGRTKLQAEAVLHELLQPGDTELTIFRPVLIYGPGVVGNFLQLLRAVDRQLPLPFGSVVNARSFLYVGNFVDAVATALDSEPVTSTRTFLIADAEAVSTPDLLRRLARLMDKRVRLLPVPTQLLSAVGRPLGLSEPLRKLLTSLEVRPGAIWDSLGWRPPISLDEGLERTVNWFRGTKSGAGGELCTR